MNKGFRKSKTIASCDKYPHSIHRFRSSRDCIRCGQLEAATDNAMKQIRSDLVSALQNGDLDALKEMLGKGLDAERRSLNAILGKRCRRRVIGQCRQRPSLIRAIEEGSLEKVKDLLSDGVNCNDVHENLCYVRRKERRSALHKATLLGLTDIVEALLDAGANSNVFDENSDTPLHIAVNRGNISIVRLLLSSGADPKLTDRSGNAVIHIATSQGHLNLVRTLIEFNADVHQMNAIGQQAVHVAAAAGHFHIIHLLCSADPRNVMAKDSAGHGPIHLAAENGHVETVTALLDLFGADPNEKNLDGEVPLLRLLLKPYRKNIMRDMVYYYATFMALVQYGAALDVENSKGLTLLEIAEANQYTKIAEALKTVKGTANAEEQKNLRRDTSNAKRPFARETDLSKNADSFEIPRTDSCEVKNASVNQMDDKTIKPSLRHVSESNDIQHAHASHYLLHAPKMSDVLVGETCEQNSIAESMKNKIPITSGVTVSRYLDRNEFLSSAASSMNNKPVQPSSIQHNSKVSFSNDYHKTIDFSRQEQVSVLKDETNSTLVSLGSNDDGKASEMKTGTVCLVKLEPVKPDHYVIQTFGTNTNSGSNRSRVRMEVDSDMKLCAELIAFDKDICDSDEDFSEDFVSDIDSTEDVECVSGKETTLAQKQEGEMGKELEYNGDCNLTQDVTVKELVAYFEDSLQASDEKQNASQENEIARKLRQNENDVQVAKIKCSTGLPSFTLEIADVMHSQDVAKPKVSAVKHSEADDLLSKMQSENNAQMIGENLIPNSSVIKSNNTLSSGDERLVSLVNSQVLHSEEHPAEDNVNSLTYTKSSDQQTQSETCAEFANVDNVPCNVKPEEIKQKLKKKKKISKKAQANEDLELIDSTKGSTVLSTASPAYTRTDDQLNKTVGDKLTATEIEVTDGYAAQSLNCSAVTEEQLNHVSFRSNLSASDLGLKIAKCKKKKKTKKSKEGEFDQTKSMETTFDDELTFEFIEQPAVETVCNTHFAVETDTSFVETGCSEKNVTKKKKKKNAKIVELTDDASGDHHMLSRNCEGHFVDDTARNWRTDLDEAPVIMHLQEEPGHVQVDHLHRFSSANDEDKTQLTKNSKARKIRSELCSAFGISQDTNIDNNDDLMKDGIHNKKGKRANIENVPDWTGSCHEKGGKDDGKLLSLANETSVTHGGKQRSLSRNGETNFNLKKTASESYKQRVTMHCEEPDKPVDGKMSSPQVSRISVDSSSYASLGRDGKFVNSGSRMRDITKQNAPDSNQHKSFTVQASKETCIDDNFDEGDAVQGIDDIPSKIPDANDCSYKETDVDEIFNSDNEPFRPEKVEKDAHEHIDEIQVSYDDANEMCRDTESTINDVPHSLSDLSSAEPRTTRSKKHSKKKKSQRQLETYENHIKLESVEIPSDVAAYDFQESELLENPESSNDMPEFQFNGSLADQEMIAVESISNVDMDAGSEYHRDEEEQQQEDAVSKGATGNDSDQKVPAILHSPVVSEESRAESASESDSSDNSSGEFVFGDQSRTLFTIKELNAEGEIEVEDDQLDEDVEDDEGTYRGDVEGEPMEGDDWDDFDLSELHTRRLEKMKLTAQTMEIGRRRLYEAESDEEDQISTDAKDECLNELPSAIIESPPTQPLSASPSIQPCDAYPSMDSSTADVFSNIQGHDSENPANMGDAALMMMQKPIVKDVVKVRKSKKKTHSVRSFMETSFDDMEPVSFENTADNLNDNFFDRSTIHTNAINYELPSNKFIASKLKPFVEQESIQYISSDISNESSELKREPVKKPKRLHNDSEIEQSELPPASQDDSLNDTEDIHQTIDKLKHESEEKEEGEGEEMGLNDETENLEDVDAVLQPSQDRSMRSVHFSEEKEKEGKSEKMKRKVERKESIEDDLFSENDVERAENEKLITDDVIDETDCSGCFHRQQTGRASSGRQKKGSRRPVKGTSEKKMTLVFASPSADADAVFDVVSEEIHSDKKDTEFFDNKHASKSLSTNLSSSFERVESSSIDSDRNSRKLPSTSPSEVVMFRNKEMSGKPPLPKAVERKTSADESNQSSPDVKHNTFHTFQDKGRMFSPFKNIRDHQRLSSASEAGVVQQEKMGLDRSLPLSVRALNSSFEEKTSSSDARRPSLKSAGDTSFERPHSADGIGNAHLVAQQHPIIMSHTAQRQMQRRRPGSQKVMTFGQRRSTSVNAEHARLDPIAVKAPEKSLQEAAFESITASILTQSRVQQQGAGRRPKSEDLPLIYGQGVYRPQPVIFRGSLSAGSGFDDSRTSADLGYHPSSGSGNESWNGNE